MSSNLDRITPLILTFNEAPNIARTLEKLRWARRVVVIDSFSTDETLTIISRFPNAEVFQKKYTTAAVQDNYGLDQIPDGWVLSMDADYVLDDSFIEAMKNLDLDETRVAGYEARFKYAVFGKPLRATLYTPRKVLYFRKKAHYVDDGHTQRVVIDGPVAPVGGFILHDDRKPLSGWFANQDRYLRLEAEKMVGIPFGKMRLTEKIRWLILPAPFFSFFYCLIIKGLVLDGWRGWYYSLQRMLAEIMLSLRLIEHRFSKP